MIIFANIIHRLIKYYKISKSICYIEKSRHYIAVDNIKKAEFLFNKGEVILLSQTKELPCDYKVLKGKILYFAKKRQQCISVLKDAWDSLELQNNISSTDKLYLKEFIYSTIELYEKFFEFDKGNIEYVDINSVDLSKVTPRLMREFPMRNHPDWYKYNKK